MSTPIHSDFPARYDADFLGSMNVTARLHTRLRAAAALAAGTLALVLAGCSGSGPEAGSSQTLPASQITVLTSPRTSADSAQIVLRLADGLATATLDDTPAGREFAAMLPLQLDLRDPMGQAKSGQLPRQIDVAGADRVLDPKVGEIYYWPPSGDIGIIYDDLGQSVPPPGMVRLGVIDSGLDAVASAGNRSIIRIYPIVHTNT